MNIYIALVIIQITQVLGHSYYHIADYWRERQTIIMKEKIEEVGSDIVLSENEERVNNMLMTLKLEELENGYKDPATFLPAKHFFETKEAIANTKVYQFLKEMPKGGLLHSHDVATTSWKYLYDLTWRPNLYLCNDTHGRRLHFFNVPDNTCNWMLLSDLRANIPKFEEWFKSIFTLVTNDYHQKYSDFHKIFKAFKHVLSLAGGLVTYRPIFEEQFYHTLLELYLDNTTYLELRTMITEVYELDGTVYDAEAVVDFYYDVAKKFRHDYPDFIGVKLIYTVLRDVDVATVANQVKIFRKINKKYPNFMVGFDLTGQEDAGQPLKHFANYLSKCRINYYFHAGETNWNHAETDQNLIDAVLLRSKRIAHAVALYKHPELIKLVKKRQIAIEISPICNQVLTMVADLRNHPAAYYLANNVPMVIANDGPAFWDGEGVTYDWYMIFIGISSRSADLRMLKRLAINSILYSSMTRKEKTRAYRKWERQWSKWIGRHAPNCCC